MEERPIGSLVDSLRQAGCQIEYLKNEGYPPLKIVANGIQGGSITVDGTISSQFLTAILMACPLVQNDTTVTVTGDLVSKPYIDITLDTMRQFGVAVENHDYQHFRSRANNVINHRAGSSSKAMRRRHPIFGCSRQRVARSGNGEDWQGQHSGRHPLCQRAGGNGGAD